MKNQRKKVKSVVVFFNLKIYVSAIFLISISAFSQELISQQTATTEKVNTSLSETQLELYFPGEIYIKFNDRSPIYWDSDFKLSVSSIKELTDYADEYGIYEVENTFYFALSEKLKRVLRIRFNNKDQVEELISKMQSLPSIEYAERIPIDRKADNPNDTNLSSQWALPHIGGHAAHDIEMGSGAIDIAIVDDAIDINHVDLDNNIQLGWDVADNDNDPTPPAGASSFYDHGTHVAGIAAAETNNGIGVASIGRNVDIIAVKATNSASVITHAYAGVTWASQNGAEIINCSWSSPTYSSTNELVIQTAWNNYNCIIVAAAGNYGQQGNPIRYPAAYNNVIAVANSNQSDNKYSTSSYGSWVDITAPGYSIYSTLPGNSYGNKTGTSMASPLVAGLLGLIWSTDVNASRTSVINCLYSTAASLSWSGGGAGRIDALAALQCAAGPGACGVPVSPHTDNITQTSAKLDWSQPTGGDDYESQWREVGSSVWIDESSTGSYENISGLTCNTNYEWRVRTICNNGGFSSWSSIITFTTNACTGGGCGVPVSPHTDNITQTSATLDWGQPSGGDDYESQWREVGSSVWIDESSTGSSEGISGLTCGTNYEWRVRTVCDNGGYSSWSSIITFTTTSCTGCGVPVSPHTDNITQTSATLDWGQPSGGDDYESQWREVGSSVWIDESSTGSSEPISGLTCNTNYEWRVRTICDNGGYSAWSNIITFTTVGCTGCDAPISLQVSGVTQTSAILSWVQLSTNNGFLVQWRETGTTLWNGGVNVNTSSAGISGLDCNTSYDWRVRTYCSNSLSDWSNIHSFTTNSCNGNCDAPINPQTISITDTTATLYWGLPNGGSGYESRWRLVGTSPWTVEISPDYYEDIFGLECEEIYEWQVRTICSNGGYSDWSNTITFSTLQCSTIGFEPIQNTEFLVYPNPAQGYIGISSTNPKLVSMDILDAIGKRVATHEIDFGTSDQLIDIRDLASGIYTLQIFSDDSLVLVKKILVK